MDEEVSVASIKQQGGLKLEQAGVVFNEEVTLQFICGDL
jgi:hypothetical protein